MRNVEHLAKLDFCFGFTNKKILHLNTVALNYYQQQDLEMKKNSIQNGHRNGLK